MKKFFFTLAILFSLASLSSFANETTVTPTVLESFKSSFKTAQDVNWSVVQNIYKANFTMNGQHISAFYDEKGEMIALSRNITSMQLPISLQTGLKQKYEGLWITDLFEVANESGTFYYITLEDADTKLVLKSTESGWATYQKQRKS
jgi:hypothetical protein